MACSLHETKNRKFFHFEKNRHSTVISEYAKEILIWSRIATLVKDGEVVILGLATRGKTKDHHSRASQSFTSLLLTLLVFPKQNIPLICALDFSSPPSTASELAEWWLGSMAQWAGKQGIDVSQIVGDTACKKMFSLHHLFVAQNKPIYYIINDMEHILSHPKLFDQALEYLYFISPQHCIFTANLGMMSRLRKQSVEFYGNVVETAQLKESVVDQELHQKMARHMYSWHFGEEKLHNYDHMYDAEKISEFVSRYGSSPALIQSFLDLYEGDLEITKTKFEENIGKALEVRVHQ